MARGLSIFIIALFLTTLPVVVVLTDWLPSRNDLEIWLPQSTPERADYDRFKELFGADEFILLTATPEVLTPAMQRGLSGRLERLPGIERCWSIEQFMDIMESLGVSEDQAQERAARFLGSIDGQLVGLIAYFSVKGLENRSETVWKVNEILEYSQIPREEIYLAGPPIFTAELDRLGGKDASWIYFAFTMAICLACLYLATRTWALTLIIFGITLWAINLTLAIWYLSDRSMNFILGSITVLVMIFTIAVCIHVIHYFQSALATHAENPVRETLKLAWRPSTLAILTTMLGLISLSISDFLPVKEFAWLASLGAGLSLVAGLVITPAFLIWPQLRVSVHQQRISRRWVKMSKRLVRHDIAITVIGLTILFGTGWGLISLDALIDPVRFLPSDSPVKRDFFLISEEFGKANSVEVIVDTGPADVPFFEKLQLVKEIDEKLRQHPELTDVISVAQFFPDPLPDNLSETTSILQEARGHRSVNDFADESEQFWRITAYIGYSEAGMNAELLSEVDELIAGYPAWATGITPIVNSSQVKIFEGFWSSVVLALGMITLVMIMGLRSLNQGLLAMIPNVTPIVVVYGMMGWLGVPVDIGTMLSGSIALGMAVDGTFHFQIRYQRNRQAGQSAQRAIRKAWLNSLAPLSQAAVIASAGMLGLVVSPFEPTARFGLLMMIMMLVALLGDLILLPAIISTISRASTHEQQSSQRVVETEPANQNTPHSTENHEAITSDHAATTS